MKIKGFLLLCLPFAASAVMLTVIQPPVSWAPLAWVALVPFILACSPSVKPVPLAVAAYLISLCYWLGNLYWIAPVTVPGWLAFCLYTALLWPILAICLRYCRIKKIPLFIAVPVLFVGAERLQGLFLGGFFWRFLAHSQYANTTLIQIADIFGAAGLSFLIAMVNGLIAELMLDTRCSMLSTGHLTADARYWRSIFKISNLIKTALVCAALVATIVYGRWRISEADRFIEAGPLVASLQSNVPQSVKRAGEASEMIFAGLMQKSKAAAEAGAELIVWPETMVQAPLNKGFLVYIDESSQAKLFDRALSEHSKNNTYVLVGANAATVELQDMDYVVTEKYNSAFLYRPDGQQDQKRYDKIHLVLFGEVLPFRKSCPLLFNLLMKFNPLGYDHSLDAGREYTVFEMSCGRTEEIRLYRFGVMICYEDTVPAIARRFALDKDGRKRLDWLVNISNDGWFVRFKNGKVHPSTELAQHTAVCVFRAVENRLAVLRSVNTGISCLIDTLGRVKNGFLEGTLPSRAMERAGCEGWLLDTVPIDKRTTFFSRNGQWLDFCCAFCFVLLIIVPLLERLAFAKRFGGARFVFRKEPKNIQGQSNEKHAG